MTYASTIHVPGDYATIQAGLNAAQTGDTVMVSPGTYIENIFWPNSQSIKLLSEAGPEQTIIDADEEGSGIQFPGNIVAVNTTTIIDGFTIRNGVAPSQGGYLLASYGGGIDLRGAASPWIRNNHIEDCLVYECEGGSGGGGIAGGYDDPTGARIEGNTIENCSIIDEGGEYRGAGLYIAQADGVQLIDNIFDGNECPSSGISYGGGVCVNSGDLTISGNVFQGNKAYYGAALYLGYFSVDASISECLMEGNVGVYSNNSCICLGDGYYSISKCTITENGTDMSGIELWGDGFISIDSCTISNNSLDGIRRPGGEAVVMIHHCSIFSNDGYGIQNDQPVYISAPYCWWGNPSGPGGVGPGTGDEVSEFVYYEPWLGQTEIESPAVLNCLTCIVFPNPFSTSTKISFFLPQQGPVRLEVYDLSGRLVETPAEGEMTAGEHYVCIDGYGLALGIYLVRLQSGSETATARVVLVR
jgi:hypothetical protein